MKLKNTLLVFLGAVFMLIIIFLSGEIIIIQSNKVLLDFTYFNKINSEKISHFFLSVGSVATVLTFIYIYLQYLNDKSYKEIDIEPNLYPSVESFSVEIETSFYEESSKLKYIIPHNNPKLFNIFNAGKGVALDIEIAWDYDNEDVQKILDTIDHKLEIEVYENDKLKKVNFLQSNGTAKLEMPESYIICLVNELNPTFVGQENNKKFNKPELTLILTYYNSKNKEFKKYFKAEIDPSKELTTIKLNAITSS